MGACCYHIRSGREFRRGGRSPRRLRSVRGCVDGERGRVKAIAGEYVAEGVW